MTLQNLQQLKTEIISQYENILKLPENKKQQILQTLYSIQEIEQSDYRVNELLKAGLINDANREQQKINSLVLKVQNPNIQINNAQDSNEKQQKHRIKKLTTAKNPAKVEAEVQQITNFIKKHIYRAGREQAIRDFQYGLNILNNKRKNSTIEVFHQLKQDGDFGVKTHACLTNLCRLYPSRIICKSIQKAAITNAIFDTKNDKRVNTEKKLQYIKNDLKVERNR